MINGKTKVIKYEEGTQKCKGKADWKKMHKQASHVFSFAIRWSA